MPRRPIANRQHIWAKPNLNPRQREIVRQRALGRSNLDIAASVGVCKETVSVITGPKGIGHRRLQWLQDLRDGDTRDMIERIRDNAEVGTLVAANLMLDPAVDNRVRARLAIDAMNRDPRSAEIKRSEHVVAHVTREDIERYNDRSRRAREAAIASGALIVVEEEDETDVRSSDPD